MYIIFTSKLFFLFPSQPQLRVDLAEVYNLWRFIPCPPMAVGSHWIAAIDTTSHGDGGRILSENGDG